MYSSNKELRMIKIKKRDYLSEKKDNYYISEKIKYGTSNDKRIEDIWRGRTKKLYMKQNQEERYMLNEILKKYKSNQDELKGFNYKYILELTDLLAQKDKNFPQKRLELYNSRINNKKKTFINNTEKNILEKYDIRKKIQNDANIQLECNNKKRSKTFMTNLYGNKKNISYNNIYNKGERKNIIYLKNTKNANIYNKTYYIYNSPMKIASLKYLLTNTKNKNLRKDSLLKNKMKEKKFISSFYLTQYNSKDEDSFDTTSLVGKEAFLFSGDKEKYHEHLQKEYKFFDQPKLREVKYLFDKQKRIKLFKKLTNDKYLNYKKGDPLKNEIFNKIDREKNHIYIGKQKDMIKTENRQRLVEINTKINDKLNFYKNCKNIFQIIVKNLKNEYL